ncbi:ubiquitin c-terminal hydrolase [Vairimorpha apis BRL 01]|uniref:Ubiquitin c-terminal hydrolase n=1 Tax=Vairimorpha apis BRL 01 TaxID=1037528 RepID=T0MME1_9MICR|nr:ubiquitin c-terminal hydrolase [Vairimorpha apis BRL 01]
MYNIPKKGHVSTILEEKAKYMYFYEKIKKNFAKIECKLLKIQYRWVWKRISEIEKEGGIVSCIKGTVKRVIESKFVVQVKDYRNTVEDLDSELENIKYLMDKTNESIEIEDVKIRKFVRLVLEDESGQCLITSWLYTDEIVKDKMIMFCGLIPISTALGIHLTTNKRTYVKFYTVK